MRTRACRAQIDLQRLEHSLRRFLWGEDIWFDTSIFRIFFLPWFRSRRHRFNDRHLRADRSTLGEAEARILQQSAIFG
jgi:hypothetical protein